VKAPLVRRRSPARAFDIGPPESRSPRQQSRGEKLVEVEEVSAAKVARFGGAVKRLLLEYHHLAPLEAFLGRHFWLIKSRRCRIADELARLGVHRFNHPSTGGPQ
jgi:hypothetical protein